MITLAEKYKDIPGCGASSRFAPFSWPAASYNDQHATITTPTFTTKARRHEDFSTNERGNYSDNIFVERFADADWSTPPAGTTSMVNNLYQGMTLDAVTGLYNERARWYSPSLGTWISQDPLSYINGANTYQFVMGNPVGNVDPSGLATGLPGPQTPVLYRTGAWHSMGPNKGYWNYYYNEDLGVLVFPMGVKPQNSALEKVLEATLEGLNVFSPIGGAISALSKQLAGEGAIFETWRGTAFPEVTKTWTRCKAGDPWKLKSVKFKSYAAPTWAVYAPFGSSIMLSNGLMQDFDFTKSLIDVLKEFKKAIEK